MNKLKYYYYRLMWHFAPFFKNGKLVHIDLELNTNCNQSCIFCWHSDKDKKPPLEKFPKNQIRNVLSQARLLGAMSVKFNLRGEPLLSNNLLYAIETAQELGFIDIMINTNGIFLTDTMMILLNHAGLTKCIISVDSFDPEIYLKLHNSDKHSLLIDNINQLHKLKVSGFIKFKVIVNIHRNKFNETEKLNKYFSRYYMFDFNIRKTMNREGEHITQFELKNKRKKICPHMMRRLTIHANGEVYPCCVSYNELEDLMLNDYLNLDVAFNGSKRQRLINYYKKNKYTESCLRCTSSDISK